MEGQLKNGAILTSESGNKYTVVNLLGAGGQGEVYDVECDGKHYALKWYILSSLRLWAGSRPNRCWLSTTKDRPCLLQSDIRHHSANQQINYSWQMSPYPAENDRILLLG